MLKELEKSRNDRDKIGSDIRKMNEEHEAAMKKITEKAKTPVQEKTEEQNDMENKEDQK